MPPELEREDRPMDLGTILMIVAVIALFYFMLIRPQQKRAKEQKNLMEAIKPGDRVMTISGIVGTIRHLGEKQAIIEISPGVEMTVVKGAISTQPVEDEFEYSDDADQATPTAAAATAAIAADEVVGFEQPPAVESTSAVPAASSDGGTDDPTVWDDPTK
jgi:preprotein translocase subunit YajC